MEYPPVRSKAMKPGSKTIPILTPADTSALPGSNVYDKAVAAGQIDYSTAKTREEVALVAEKLEQAKLATDQARIDLDKHKMDLQVARGALITKEEYISRQDALINAFLELSRLTVNEACLPLPGSVRDDHSLKVSELVKQAMGEIADAVMRKDKPDVVNAAILRVFTGDENI